MAKVELDNEIEVDYYDGYGSQFDVVGMHRHKYDELVLVETGATNVLTEEQTTRCSGCYAIFAPIGHMHLQMNDETQPYKRYCIQYYPQAIAELLPEKIFPRTFYVIPLTAQEMEQLTASVQALEKSVRSGVETPAEIHRRRLLLSLIHTELVPMVQERLPGTELTQEAAQIADICIYISRHYAEPLTLDLLAKQFFISRSKLVRCFRSTLNTTVHDYITAVRIGHAKEMLRQGMSVQESARQCGFSYVTHYINVFQKSVGMTPAKYRNKYNK